MGKSSKRKKLPTRANQGVADVADVAPKKKRLKTDSTKKNCEEVEIIEYEKNIPSESL